MHAQQQLVHVSMQYTAWLSNIAFPFIVTREQSSTNTYGNNQITSVECT